MINEIEAANTREAELLEEVAYLRERVEKLEKTVDDSMNHAITLGKILNVTFNQK